VILRPRAPQQGTLWLTLRSARADQAVQIDENTGDFDASIRRNRNWEAGAMEHRGRIMRPLPGRAPVTTGVMVRHSSGYPAN